MINYFKKHASSCRGDRVGGDGEWGDGRALSGGGEVSWACTLSVWATSNKNNGVLRVTSDHLTVLVDCRVNLGRIINSLDSTGRTRRGHKVSAHTARNS